MRFLWGSFEGCSPTREWSVVRTGLSIEYDGSTPSDRMWYDTNWHFLINTRDLTGRRIVVTGGDIWSNTYHAYWLNGTSFLMGDGTWAGEEFRGSPASSSTSTALLTGKHCLWATGSKGRMSIFTAVSMGKPCPWVTGAKGRISISTAGSMRNPEPCSSAMQIRARYPKTSGRTT